MTTINSVGIVGLGLLGSSLAATLKAKAPKIQIHAASSSKTTDIASQKNLIDKAYNYDSLNELLHNTEMLFLCVPIQKILSILQKWECKPLKTNHRCIILDVGSTKEAICSQAKKTFTHSPQLFFIGSHPMTGSEKSGIASCDPILYENATWILCPTPEIPNSILKQTQQFLEDLGSNCLYLNTQLHDKIVAQFSHLPQLISTGLAGFLKENTTNVAKGLSIAGEGFNSMTRLAQSPFDIWKDIFETNSVHIAKDLQKFINYLKQVHQKLHSENKSELDTTFRKAQDLRNQYQASNQNFHSYSGELFVQIADVPGSLAQVLSILAKKKLNIMNTHLLKIKEQESGNLLIQFKHKQESAQALETLAQKNYQCYLR